MKTHTIALTTLALGLNLMAVNSYATSRPGIVLSCQSSAEGPLNAVTVQAGQDRSDLKAQLTLNNGQIIPAKAAILREAKHRKSGEESDSIRKIKLSASGEDYFMTLQLNSVVYDGGEAECKTIGNNFTTMLIALKQGNQTETIVKENLTGFKATVIHGTELSRLVCYEGTLAEQATLSNVRSYMTELDENKDDCLSSGDGGPVLSSDRELFSAALQRYLLKHGNNLSISGAKSFASPSSN